MMTKDYYKFKSTIEYDQKVADNNTDQYYVLLDINHCHKCLLTSEESKALGPNYKYKSFAGLHMFEMHDKELVHVGLLSMWQFYSKHKQVHFVPFLSKFKHMQWSNYYIDHRGLYNYRALADEGFPTYPTFDVYFYGKAEYSDWDSIYQQTVTDKKNVLALDNDKVCSIEDIKDCLQSAIDYREVKKANKKRVRAKRDLGDL